MIVTQEEERQALEGNDTKSKVDQNDAPPSYEEASTRASTSRPEATPSTSQQSQLSGNERELASATRANFVQVVTPYRSIAGHWNIDLSLPSLVHKALPTTQSNFLSHDGSRPNLFLSTENRPIDGKVHITKAGAAATSRTPRALTMATSGFGNVSIDIRSRQAGIKIHICASSNNGNIIVRLPKDFQGPVRCRAPLLEHNVSAVRFTPRVKERMTVISIEKTDMYAFVGDMTKLHDGQDSALAESSENHPPRNQSYDEEKRLPPTPGDVPAVPQAVLSPESMTPLHSWTGDEVEVVATHGRIKICYSLQDGEEKEAEGEFQTVYRHLQENGPVVALAKFAIRGVSKAVSRKPKERGGDN